MKEQRLRRGMTLRDLARECTERGVSVDFSQLSRIERGEMKPRPKLRATLSEILGLDVTLTKIEARS